MLCYDYGNPLLFVVLRLRPDYKRCANFESISNILAPIEIGSQILRLILSERK